ncbi:MAG: DNA methyltransferase [Bacteroidia bacterium]|nr:DNA methyltransferase [Bacteroidia bacterium]
MSENRAVLYLADSRSMAEIPSESIALVITSPPYWHIKDYGILGQIGHGQSLHEYLYDLARVWQECWRVLAPGRRLCINIGDQFTRSIVYGRYRVLPLHAEIIAQCEVIGFEYLGSIIWRKKTTMRPSGGAVIMGSFPYPPNGIVELDYEYILIFRKPGKASPLPGAQREESKLTTEAWKSYFSGHWYFAGQRQVGHEAMFPPELPQRLIRMFSFVGETVLDPFAGSGTTLAAALELGRSAIGYEIQEDFLPLIQQKVGTSLWGTLEIRRREKEVSLVAPPSGYRPFLQDIQPPQKAFDDFPEAPTFRIADAEIEAGKVWLTTHEGKRIRLLGIEIPPEKREETLKYLQKYIRGKSIFVRMERDPDAYVYLKNRLFVNRKMIEMGLAVAEDVEHRYKEKFIRAQLKNSL